VTGTDSDNVPPMFDLTSTLSTHDGLSALWLNWQLGHNNTVACSNIYMPLCDDMEAQILFYIKYPQLSLHKKSNFRIALIALVTFE